MSNVDITQALKDTENALRDFIASVLQNAFGDSWVAKCGVTQERIEKWQERKVVEEKRQEAGTVEERLIYYADFFDLKTILKKHWDKFTKALGEWKRMEVFLDELERMRDPDAHRRELLPHQKFLAVGIAGEIRSRLIRYRSKHETSSDYFPRIESIKDSAGNLWIPGKSMGKFLQTETILRPGDILHFVITASDPEDALLTYTISIQGSGVSWQKENTFSIEISKEHISTDFDVMFYIRSPRDYHAGESYDDSVLFRYKVLPQK